MHYGMDVDPTSYVSAFLRCPFTHCLFQAASRRYSRRELPANFSTSTPKSKPSTSTSSPPFKADPSANNPTKALELPTSRIDDRKVVLGWDTTTYSRL